MLIQDGVEAFVFLFILSVFAFFLGEHIRLLVEGKRTWLHPGLEKIEEGLYRFLGISSHQGMDLKQYLLSLLSLHTAGFLFLFCLFFFQGWLPLNPNDLPGLPWLLSISASVSIITNTGWQPYAPETTLSPLTHMLGITSQNFLTAATGISVTFALMRSIKSETMGTLGNFWCDLIRSILYLLLPLSFLFSIFLLVQGVPETLTPQIEIQTLEGQKQIIPLGAAATQTAISLLGSSGASFYQASLAHPLANPTNWTIWIELGAVLLIPAALPFAFGALTKRRTGILLFLVGLCPLLMEGVFLSFYSEYSLEGVETRIGPFLTYFWTALGSSSGSLVGDLASLHPAAFFFSFFNIITRQVFLGNVGIGFNHLIMYVFVTLFAAGHLVGKTSDFFGKKIGVKEIQWSLAALVAPCCLILGVLLILLPFYSGQSLREMSGLFYLFSAAGSNNGSTLTPINLSPLLVALLSLTMLLGRATTLVTTLCLAQGLSKKKIHPSSLGIAGAEGLFFGIALFLIILLSACVVFFPLLTLGPFFEWALFEPQLFKGDL